MPKGEAILSQAIWVIKPIASLNWAVTYSDNELHYRPAIEQYI